jgi:hypothetical protein
MTAVEPSIFRRRIIVDAVGNSVHAGVEDDFHHYEILLTHDGSVITSASADSIRTPFVTCFEAGAQLALLTGHPIVTRPTGLPDPHHQCTHMFELAVVAIAQAVRGGRRQYDIAVPHRELGGVGSVTLHRDGELVFDWALDGDLISMPPDYGGKNVRELARWAEAECDDETLEAIRVIRRGIHVSSGRSIPPDMYVDAAAIPQILGACYVFQPIRVDRGVRDGDKRRDFSRNAAAMLNGFDVRSVGEYV